MTKTEICDTILRDGEQTPDVCFGIRPKGCSFGEEAPDVTFARFKEAADKKAVTTADDSRAILSEYLDSIEGRCRPSSFQIQSGSRIKACLNAINKWDRAREHAAPA